jgi:hypothetical protein
MATARKVDAFVPETVLRAHWAQRYEIVNAAEASALSVFPFLTAMARIVVWVWSWETVIGPVYWGDAWVGRDPSTV